MIPFLLCISIVLGATLSLLFLQVFLIAFADLGWGHNFYESIKWTRRAVCAAGPLGMLGGLGYGLVCWNLTGTIAINSWLLGMCGAFLLLQMLPIEPDKSISTGQVLRDFIGGTFNYLKGKAMTKLLFWATIIVTICFANGCGGPSD